MESSLLIVGLLRLFDKIKFFTPFPRKRGRRKTKENPSFNGPQEKWNHEMRAVRARVELPYALLKNKWNALADPFREDELLQDYLVFLAVAFHNASLWIDLRCPCKLFIDNAARRVRFHGHHICGTSDRNKTTRKDLNESHYLQLYNYLEGSSVINKRDEHSV